jgi:hypothetical protein
MAFMLYVIRTLAIVTHVYIRSILLCLRSGTQTHSQAADDIHYFTLCIKVHTFHCSMYALHNRFISRVMI